MTAIHLIRWEIFPSFSRVISMGDGKKPCVRIGTHDGTFHCDDALAVFLLKLLPQYRDAEVVRSRKPEVLAPCDVVVDVGGVFDPATHRYDHHQREFTETMNSLNSKHTWKTKLSSAGLVYAHFGHDIISIILKTTESALIETIFERMYTNFVEEIDAVDNGVNHCDSPAYRITTTVSSRVGRLNPSWNESNGPAPDELFLAASQLVGGEFVERALGYANSWWPAREVVVAAIRSRTDEHKSGKVIRLAQFAPWQEHLFELETELGIVGEILYVIYADSSGGHRIQCVSEKPGSFSNRRSLPAAWRGVRDEVLSELAGVPGCVFVHAGGFIGGNKTLEGVLAMAAKALTID